MQWLAGLQLPPQLEGVMTTEDMYLYVVVRLEQRGIHARD